MYTRCTYGSFKSVHKLILGELALTTYTENKGGLRKATVKQFTLFLFDLQHFKFEWFFYDKSILLKLINVLQVDDKILADRLAVTEREVSVHFPPGLGIRTFLKGTRQPYLYMRTRYIGTGRGIFEDSAQSRCFPETNIEGI